MKKILWLASWYPNKLQPITGDFIQRHAQAVSKYQPVHVIFVVKDNSGIITTDLKVEYFNNGNLTEVVAYYSPVRSGVKNLDRLLSFLKYLQVSWRLIVLFIRQNGIPPLVHVHVALRSAILAYLVKVKYHIPYIITEHWTGYHPNSPETLYNKGLIFRKVAKYIIKNASCLLPDSKQLGVLINQRVVSIPFINILNTVNTTYFEPGKKKPTEFRFIHVSSMSYQKNVEGILNGLPAFQLLCKNWEFAMIGPAPVELRAYCTRLGLDVNVRWCGELSYEQVAEEMKKSSVFVLFSRYENMPCVLLEALCCGLPVITTNVGGIAEVINDENGILLSAGDEDELVNSMWAMMNRYDDFDRAKIAANAFHKFNYDTIGNQIKAIYDSVLNSQQR